MSIYEAYAFYTNSGSGVAGLTVNCNIYSSASGLVASGSPTIDIGGGFYKSSYDAPSDSNYLFKFFTSSSSVDSQIIPSFYSDKTEIPTSVWTYATRTLSSFGTLVSDVWGYLTRTLTSTGSSIPSDIWSYPARSLSQTSVDDPHYPATVNTDITFYTYSSNSVTITGVADETEIWFTVKKNASVPDSESLVQISKTGGLIYLNGHSASALGLPSSSGCVVVVDGNALVSLTDEAAPVLSGHLPNDYKGEIKVRTNSGAELVITQFNVIIKQALTRA